MQSIHDLEVESFLVDAKKVRKHSMNPTFKALT